MAKEVDVAKIELKDSKSNIDTEGERLNVESNRLKLPTKSIKYDRDRSNKHDGNLMKLENDKESLEKKVKQFELTLREEDAALDTQWRLSETQISEFRSAYGQ